MVNPVPLDNVTHSRLRVVTQHRKEFVDDVNQVPTFPTEFGDIQREYPILFRKDSATDEYQSVAILGFDPGENLFLSDSGWTAGYVPAVIAKGPFLIGFQGQNANGGRTEPVIHVDMDNPRLSEEDGEPVFLPQGGQSAYLEHVSAILNAIYRGIEAGKRMFQSFEKHDLIEPVQLSARLSDSESYEFKNYYTVSRDKLQALDGASLESLNREGFLEGAYLVIASLTNMHRLIARKQNKARGL